MRTGMKRWSRRLAMVVSLYLVLWGVTNVFGPSAVERWFEKRFIVGQSFGGQIEPVHHVRNATFKGTGLDFFPDPEPEAKWFCCTSTPIAICPFIVTTQCVYIDGPLSGYGGDMTFLWTPFGTWGISEKKRWVS